MAPATTDEVYEQVVKALPAEERIRLVEKIAHGLSARPADAPDRRSWRSICGVAPDLLGGEDEQEWVSSTRRESDEHRERQLRRKELAMKQVDSKDALKRKYPEWIILVVTRDAAGRPDVMPAGWGMICSGTPPMVCVAVAQGRHTHRCIEETGEFVFAWAGEGQAELVAYAGSTSGAQVNKFDERHIPTAPAAVVAVPLLAEAAANLECKVRQAIPTGDHTIFVGEVVAAHVPDTPIAKLDNFGDGVYAVAFATK